MKQATGRNMKKRNLDNLS